MCGGLSNGLSGIQGLVLEPMSVALHGKRFCTCDEVNGFEMGRLSWIVWVGFESILSILMRGKKNDLIILKRK